MQGMNMLPFLSSYSTKNNTFANPAPHYNKAFLLAHYQHSILKQQAILQLLLQKQQELNARQYLSLSLYQTPQNNPFLYTEKQTFFSTTYASNTPTDQALDGIKYIKEEDDSSSQSMQRVSSTETAVSGQDFVCKNEFTPEFDGTPRGNETDDSSSIDEQSFKIMRRNDFKQQVLEGLVSKRKSNRHITPKRPPPKAKHLWINYGRRIIDYALTQTTGNEKVRIKGLVGRLGSKQDFDKIFEVKPNDSEEEKSFKVFFGELALYFIAFKADEAFKDSKYRDQLIKQKHVVLLHIKKLIGWLPENC